jgi:hypothetical protein
MSVTPEETQQRIELSRQLMKTVGAAERAVAVREAGRNAHRIAATDRQVDAHATALAELLAALVEPAE